MRVGPEGIASQFACPLAKPGTLTSKTMTARAIQAVIPPARPPHGSAVVFSNNGIVAKSHCARISSAASRNAGICFDGPASRLRLRPCRSICRCNSQPCLHMTIPVLLPVNSGRCRCLKGRSRKKSAVSCRNSLGRARAVLILAVRRGQIQQPTSTSLPARLGRENRHPQPCRAPLVRA